jgi:hypothetical protein
MTIATRVRSRRYIRQPMLTPHWTPGEHQPTALALAAAGLLGRVAERMGKNVATLEKWAQGERGPEYDCSELFPALRAVGVPRDRAGLVVARITAMHDAAYRDQLPTLKQLHKPETAIDNAEDDTQMDCALSDDDLDAQARHLPNVLADIAMQQTVAARITRNLQAAGRL